MNKHIVIAKPIHSFCAEGMGCGNLTRLGLRDCHARLTGRAGSLANSQGYTKPSQ